MHFVAKVHARGQPAVHLVAEVHAWGQPAVHLVAEVACRLHPRAEVPAPRVDIDDVSASDPFGPHRPASRPWAAFGAVPTTAGRPMRWETSHQRCDTCGHIVPCCEGAPLG